MTSIVIYEFGGMIPRSGDEFLPPDKASDAANCILLSGELRPLHKPSLLNQFYPPATHQENAGAITPDEGYFDEYLAALPLALWIQGYKGVFNSAVAGNVLTSPASTYVGQGTFSDTSAPLAGLNGLAMDSTGRNGAATGMLNPNQEEWTEPNSSRGDLLIGGAQVLTGSYTGVDGVASFMAKSHNAQTMLGNMYEIHLDVGTVYNEWPIDGGTGLPFIHSFSFSVNQGGGFGANPALSETVYGNGTISAQPAPFVLTDLWHSGVGGNVGSPNSHVGVDIQSSVIYDTDNDRPNSVSFELGLSGHAAGIYSWSGFTWTNNSDYTIHIIHAYRDTIAGGRGTVIPAHAFQAIYTGGRSGDQNGMEMYLVNGVITVQHGENQVITFSHTPLVHGSTYQIVVTYNDATQDIKLYLGGVLIDTQTQSNTQGSNSANEAVGIVEKAGDGLTNGRFLWGKWQHLFHMPVLLDDTEVANLYGALVADQ